MASCPALSPKAYEILRGPHISTERKTEVSQFGPQVKKDRHGWFRAFLGTKRLSKLKTTLSLPERIRISQGPLSILSQPRNKIQKAQRRHMQKGGEGDTRQQL